MQLAPAEVQVNQHRTRLRDDAVQELDAAHVEVHAGERQVSELDVFGDAGQYLLQKADVFETWLDELQLLERHAALLFNQVFNNKVNGVLINLILRNI